MRSASFPANETQRLRALRGLSVLDTPPEPAFDDITALAGFACGRHMALLSLVDADRQWFKSKRGVEATETPREVAFCAHAILNPDKVMVVEDTRQDDRFFDNPLVTGEPHIRFYAGAPLVTANGEALGTLCVLDREPGEMSEAEIEALRALARQAMVQLEARRSDVALLRTELEEARSQIKALEAKLTGQGAIQKALCTAQSFREAVIECAAEGVCVCHSTPSYPFLRFTVWNKRMAEITGYTIDEINHRGWCQTLYPDPELQRRAAERMDRMWEGDDLRFERCAITRRDGSKRVVAISTSSLTSADSYQHVLALLHDFTEQENLQREALRGRVDGLTGVMTLRAFREEAAMILGLASRSGAPTALGFLDLDDLKMVNDHLGHAEGDRVLECVGRILTDAIRSTDVVGRLGGDEFALLLPNTGAAGAKTFFDRLHRDLLHAMRDHRWSVGVSMGVAIFADAPPGEREAVAYADKLMYRAKKNGKNRAVYAEFPR